ncbi:protein BUD31 homolog 2 isoform X1, partial [Fagus crenata]
MCSHSPLLPKKVDISTKQYPNPFFKIRPVDEDRGTLMKHEISKFDFEFVLDVERYADCRTMPKVKTNRVKYPEGWELIEPTLRDLQAKMREAENDTHDGKRKCEALWPIFKIAHQKSRYIFDLYHRRKEISKELYDFCLDQGYADRNIIAKWKKPGYERLCCLRCIQPRDHNFSTT